MYEELVRLRDSAYRVLVVQDCVAFLDERQQILSVVVSVGLPLDAVDVLGRRGEDRDGVVAYEHHAISGIDSATHSIALVDFAAPMLCAGGIGVYCDYDNKFVQ